MEMITGERQGPPDKMRKVHVCQLASQPAEEHFNQEQGSILITDPGFGGNFSLLDVCYKHRALECKQSGRFLKGIKDNFLILAGPTRGDSQLDLLFSNKEELGDMVIRGLVIKAWAVVTE